MLSLPLDGQVKPPAEPPPERPKTEVNPPSRAEVPKSGEGTVTPVNPDTYLIGPEDVLFIRVWREPDFTQQNVVRPDGKITMPLLGDLQAAGLTPSQLAAELGKRLTDYIRNKPDVAVFLLQINSKQYIMAGEVGRPGPYVLTRKTTVLDAIGLAGGLKEFANQKKILIMRGTQRIYFNYKEVISGKKLEQNIDLEPGDYIFVK